MQYVYTAMVLHSAKQPVTEANMKKVLEAAGVHPDETRVKALVAALDGVDIEKAIQEASVPMAAPAAAAAAPAAKKEEKKKEEKPSEEQAAAGLGALFG